MSLKTFLNNLFFTKASQARHITVMNQMGSPSLPERNLENFSKEGYEKNVIAYRAVSTIARGASQIPWVLFSKDSKGEKTEIESHPLLDLMRKPNPMQGQAAFIECLCSFYFIAGNSFIEGVRGSGNQPKELYCVNPAGMKIIPGVDGFPKAYVYDMGGKKHVWDVDFITKQTEILHLLTFNPNDMFWGMSPIQAAALSIDQHNESSMWNLALLQNKATPSGTFTVEVSDRNPAGTLDDGAATDLRRELETRYSGSRNAGRPMVLQGGLKWQQMSFTPEDMNWILGKNSTARDIALALGMPPMLLGIQGDNTYSNQKEARLALYEETILPWMDIFRDELNNWLVPSFGDNLFLDYNADDLPALAVKRAMIWDRLNTTDWLSDNEKREAAGYEPIDNELADEIWKSSAVMPLSMLGEDLGGETIEQPDEETEIDDDVEDDDPIDDLNGLDDDPINEDIDQDESSICLDYEEKIDSSTRFDDFVVDYVTFEVGKKIKHISGATRRRVISDVRAAILDNQTEPITTVAKAIQKNINKSSAFNFKRALKIARTETTTASNQASLGAAKSLKIPNLLKEWVPSSAEKARENHQEMQGVKVPIDEEFMVPSPKGPDTPMDGPGDPNAPPHQTINCGCTLVYERENVEKVFNLRSHIEKQRFWRKISRQRVTDIRRFQKQLQTQFKRDQRAMVKAVSGLKTFNNLENIIHDILDKSDKRLEKIFASNYTVILKRFGRDVLKLEV